MPRYAHRDPIKLARPAVWLEGGPRDGWCYYADEWDEKVRVALAGFSPPLPYRPTDRLVEHPNDDSGAHRMCSVWEFTG